MGYIKYIPLLSPPLRGKGREGRERERGETGGGGELRSRYEKRSSRKRKMREASIINIFNKYKSECSG
jgi:hypothetical protein